MRTLLRFLAPVCSAWLALVGGCGGPPREQAEISPVETRIDVIAGHTLILPVELQGPIDPAARIEARLDDGRRPDAALFWISVGPDADPDPRGWLAAAGTWYATPASASSRPSAAGVWAVVLDLPADARGQGLWLDGQRLGLNWLSDPGGDPIVALPPPETAASPWLPGLLAPERESPARRWRWRLIRGGLGASKEAEESGFADPVLEALAVQTESRWAIGLRRLRDENPALGTELAGRLGQVVELAGSAAPAWPAEARELESLLSDLLSPGLTPPRRAERVRAWLDAGRHAIAWVADDAGRRDPATGAGIATIGVANLLATGVLAGVVPDEEALPSELIPLAPGAAVMLSTALLPGDGPSAAHSVRVRAGATERTMEVLSGRLASRPPGLRIGPLLADWTMGAWLDGTPAAAPDAGATALLLMKEPGAPGAGWTIFLQAQAQADGAAPDVFRVWLGQTGSPAAVLRVSSDGLIIDESPRAARSRDPAKTPVARDPGGRWSCRIGVPSGCIEADGTLRIGIERVDPSGRRSAWPRPMLPWQTEPGRAAVDTSVWGDLGPDQSRP